MSATSDRTTSLVALAGIAWAGLVLWACQRSQPPLGLVALVLLALWVSVFALASWGGAAVLWRIVLRRAPDGPDEFFVALILGTGPLALAAALLGAVGALRPVPVLIVFALFAAGGAAAFYRGPHCAPIPWPVSASAIVPALLVAAAWSLNVLSVTTDSAFYDQLHYHLAFPAQWLRAGSMVTFPRHGFSYYPSGIGLLYVYALAGLGPWGAQAIHWFLGLLAVAAAARVGLRVAGPRAFWWTAAILSATPVVMWLTTLAGSDLGVAAYGAAGWLMLAHSLQKDTRDRASYWILIGAAAGLAVGAKLLAVATVGLPLFVAYALAPGPAARRVKRLLAFSAAGAAVVAPWLVRNALQTGNPLYPFLPSLFGAAGQTAAQLQYGASMGTVRLFSDPLRVATLGALGWQDGAVGPLYLLLLPIAAWCGYRVRATGRLLLVASVLGVLGWGMGYPLAGRYLVPVLVPLAALAGGGVALLAERAARGARIALTAALAVTVTWSMLGGVDQENLLREAVVLGQEKPDAVLAKWVSYWPAVAAVNELPPSARVLLVAESRTLYFDRAVVFDDAYRRPLLSEIAESAPSPDAMAAALRAQGVTHVFFNGIEARRLAALNHRDDYFGDLAPGARARLEEFRGHHLAPVWHEGELALYALR